jgi:uncharacterized protein (TIGR03437 family)
LRLLPCFILLAGSLAAQSPSFTGIVNPASDLPPGAPNYGIAQGSVFIIYGKNLSGAGFVQAGLPLTTTLNGITSITISQSGGATVTAPILYASPGQVAAIMPSTASIGNDTLTLSNNGQVGSFSVAVTASSFGISTGDGSGNGAGAVTFGDYSYVSPTDAAQPGDTLIVWGTGLGALPAGNSDASGAPYAPTTATIQVLVGGVPATSIIYAGRAPGAVGLDQINFTVPANAPLGCQISIIVQTTSPTGTVSNGPTFAIAATHHTTCTDPTQDVSQGSIPGLLSKSNIKALVIQAKLSTSYSFPQGAANPVATTDGTADTYFFSFSHDQLAAQASGFNGTTSLNSCYTLVVPASTSGGNGPNASFLDGGSSVVWEPSSGPALTLSAAQVGTYQANVSSLSGGTYQFTTAGGAAVGPLSFSFSLPQPITWTNMNTLLSGPIDRTQPLVINWTGGDANGFVEIVGQAQLGPSGGATYTLAFDCAAPASALSFTIPSAVLQMMPAGTNAYASLQVNTDAYPATIPTPGAFDFGINISSFQTSIPVVFK